MSDSTDPRRPAQPARPAQPPAPAPPAAPSPPVAPSTPPVARHAAPPRRETSIADSDFMPQEFSLADADLSGVPALEPTPPTAAKPIAVGGPRLSSAACRTLLPSCLVLASTLPLLAMGWFTLDRFSVLRDNGLGLFLPIALGVIGLAFLVATVLLWAQLRPPADRPGVD